MVPRNFSAPFVRIGTALKGISWSINCEFIKDWLNFTATSVQDHFLKEAKYNITLKRFTWSTTWDLNATLQAAQSFSKQKNIFINTNLLFTVRIFFEIFAIELIKQFLFSEIEKATCKTCGKVFTNKIKLSRHEHVVHHKKRVK